MGAAGQSTPQSPSRRHRSEGWSPHTCWASHSTQPRSSPPDGHQHTQTHQCSLQRSAVRIHAPKTLSNKLQMKDKLTMALHDDEELDDHFWRGPDHDLPLPTLLCVVHTLQRIIKDADSHHLCLACICAQQISKINIWTRTRCYTGNSSKLELRMEVKLYRERESISQTARKLQY
jgi:hypothetical protein